VCPARGPEVLSKTPLGNCSINTHGTTFLIETIVLIGTTVHIGTIIHIGITFLVGATVINKWINK
jgi:hypothetical protein